MSKRHEKKPVPDLLSDSDELDVGVYREEKKKRTPEQRKKLTVRIVAVVLAVVFAAGIVSGVLYLKNRPADTTPAVMTYKGTVVTEAMYTYWMSTYKTYFLELLGGEDTEEFLNTVYTTTVNDDGTETDVTVGEYLEGYILDIIRSNLISLYLYDEYYGLTLADTAKTTVEENIQSEIENAGSRKALNEELAPLGLNMSILEEIYIAEEKIDDLYAYLYGETMSTSSGTTSLSSGAEPISDEAYNEYYQAHYAYVQHIYIRTYDKNVLDDDGNVQYDDDGNVVTALLTDEEREEKLALIDSILKDLDLGAKFDSLEELYSEDSGRYTYPDGYIITSASNLPTAFVEAAFDMEIGEIRRVDYSTATSIMLKKALPEKGWEDDDYSAFLSDFQDYVKSEVFAEKIAPMLSDITYEEDLMEEHSILNTPTTAY